jgi:tRNA1(Val) A37 N6-methylase TrmN6
MTRYYTPIDVARALARHVPKKVSTILEPAVGTGVLLDPLKQSLRSSASKIVCIDKDQKALTQLRAKFAPLWGDRLEIVNTDFLQWSAQSAGKLNEAAFECILMNPPFEAKRARFVDLHCSAEMSNFTQDVKRVPVEVAFVVKAVRLLRPGGRLLAIVPSSIVASLSTKWLREYLLKAGAVRYVHELPHFTFQGVGARVYLFVFEKQEKQRNLLLLNHDLDEPESLKIKKSELSPDFRFDYGFHNARSWCEKLKERKKRLKWLPIKDVAYVLKGDMKSPVGARRALHTTDYKDGFWSAGERKKQLRKGTNNHKVMNNDLLVKRVGKDCSKSFGITIDANGYTASDCVILIRPHKSSDKLKLLFAIRTFLGAEVATALLERGTGAPYLTVVELPNAQVPVNLAEVYPAAFANYREAVRSHRFRDMLSIENQVRKTL